MEQGDEGEGNLGGDGGQASQLNSYQVKIGFTLHKIFLPFWEI